MNKRQKEVQQQFLDNEKKVFKDLDGVYKNALNDINKKIELLMARQDADMQHVIYQVEYQKALKTQVQSILETLQTNEFETVSEYLTKSYEDGFIGTMYDLHGQGIPLVFPLDQEQIVAAIRLESKLKSDLYTEMGHDIRELRKQIAAEISRGISTGLMYQDITRNIANYANIPKGRAKNIVRTDGHRIQIKATSDAQHKAKEKGADIVKGWDSTLDGVTRKMHRELDGQVQELDKPFKIGKYKPMYPGDFNDPGQDCNCRCALLQRARWALGNNYTKWSEDAPVVISDDGTTQFTIIEAKNYKEFQKKYTKAAEQVEKKASERVRQGAQKMKNDFVPAKSIEEAEEYAKRFCNDGFMAKSFKGQIDFKGISLESANEINKALTDVFETLDIDKISGIKVVSPTSAAGKKAFKDGADAVFSYSPIEHGIFVNKEILKDTKAFQKYVEESEDAWKLVMENIDSLTESQKELAMLYKNAGRSLVDGKTIDGMFRHELGHHAQWTLLDTKTNNAVGANMSKYAPKISGYANASKSEYLAESFAAYMKGETEILDPEFVKYLDSKKALEKYAKSSTIVSGAVSGARNPFGEKAKEHAQRYYGLVRSMKTDVAKISKVTGMSEEDVQTVKNFIFLEKHDLGGKELEYFEPDYMMAESWQRLAEGKPEKHDITLLKHEIMERELMKDGLSQEEAHIKTSQKYNYSKEAGEYYAKIEKFKKE